MRTIVSRFAIWPHRRTIPGSVDKVPAWTEATEFTAATVTRKAYTYRIRQRARRPEDCFFCGRHRGGKSDRLIRLDRNWPRRFLDVRRYGIRGERPKERFSLAFFNLVQVEGQPRQGRGSARTSHTLVRKQRRIARFRREVARGSFPKRSERRLLRSCTRATTKEECRPTAVPPVDIASWTFGAKIPLDASANPTPRRKRIPHILEEAPQRYRLRRRCGDPTARLRSSAPAEDTQTTNGSGLSRTLANGLKPFSFPTHRSTSRICEAKRSSPRSTSADTRAPDRRRRRASRRDCDDAPPDPAPP